VSLPDAIDSRSLLRMLFGVARPTGLDLLLAYVLQVALTILGQLGGGFSGGFITFDLTGGINPTARVQGNPAPAERSAGGAYSSGHRTPAQLPIVGRTLGHRPLTSACAPLPSVPIGQGTVPVTQPREAPCRGVLGRFGTSKPDDASH